MTVSRAVAGRLAVLAAFAAAGVVGPDTGGPLAVGPSAVAAQVARLSNGAGERANIPAPARALVVAIRAYRETGTVAENGAGFVLGVSDDSVYIATAAHVVVNRESRTFVVFEHARTDSIRANVSHRSDDLDRLDLAILAVPLARVGTRPFSRFLDRRGDDLSVRLGDGVIPVGCPDGTEGCWTAPSPPDRILSQGARLTFQSTFVRPGSSGGALFNEDWEVVGMVVTDQPPRAEAIAVGDIVLQAGVWGIDPDLVPPSVPRSGYDVTVGGSIMFPSSSEGRAPSARVGVSYPVGDRFSLVGGLLRLAPSDLGARCPADFERVGLVRELDQVPARCDAVANAVAAGLSLDLRLGRLGVHPLFEVGFAAVTGRWDSGGIYVDSQYQPIWNIEETTGLTWGVATTIDFIVMPRVLVEAIVGNWGVPDPFRLVPSGAGLNAEFPSLCYGVGLRIGF